MSNNIKQKLADLEKEREKCDSKTREKEIIEEIKSLNPSQFNGQLVKCADGAFFRVWHSFYGTFKLYGKDRYRFNWTSNMRYCTDLTNIEFIDENNDELVEKLDEIDYEISHLESKIRNLKTDRAALTKEFIPYVDPTSFEETEEENRNAISLGGDKVYISEAFCSVTNVRVTS